MAYRCQRANTATGLRPPQNDHLQSRDVGEVLGVQGEQPEMTLDRLRGEPQIVHAHVRIPARPLELGRQDPKCLSRFDRDPQLRFSTQATEHGRGAWLLARWKQLQAK